MLKYCEIVAGLLFLLSFSVFLTGCKTDPQDESFSTSSTEVSAIENEGKGLKIYQTSPRSAIHYFKLAAAEFEREGNFKKAGITNLNIANIYDEHLYSTDSALIFSSKSLEIWKSLNDTLQMANLYKYVGLLKGRNREIVEGINHILNAIELYKEKSFTSGLAVSYINLSELQLIKGDYHESERLFLESNDIWNERGNLSRRYSNNILGIKIYQNIGDTIKMRLLIQENIDIMNNYTMDTFAVKKFNEVIEAL